MFVGYGFSGGVTKEALKMTRMHVGHGRDYENGGHGWLICY